MNITQLRYILFITLFQLPIKAMQLNINITMLSKELIVKILSHSTNPKKCPLLTTCTRLYWLPFPDTTSIVKRYTASVKNKYRATPLIYAAKKNHPYALSKMLDLGSNVNQTDDIKFIPLHWAVCMGHIKIVELLLAQKDINVCATNDRGWQTPISNGIYHAMYKIRNNSEKIVLLLLKHVQKKLNLSKVLKQTYHKLVLFHASTRNNKLKIGNKLMDYMLLLDPQNSEAFESLSLYFNSQLYFHSKYLTDGE